MLYLDINEEKTLTFEVEINGVGCDEMCGSVRFQYEDMEYGFPVVIDESKITTVIKPLNKLFPTMKNGTVFEARLDLSTETYYFSPWQDEITVQAPVSVEAKLSGSPGGKKVGVKATVISEEKVTKTSSPPKKVIKEDKSDKWSKEKLKNITTQQIFEFMERAGTKNKKIQKVIFESAQANAKSADNYTIFTNVVKALKKPKK